MLGYPGFGWGRGFGRGRRKGFGFGRLVMSKLAEKGSVSLEEIQQELEKLGYQWFPGWRCWFTIQQLRSQQESAEAEGAIKDLEKRKEELEREIEELERRLKELKKKTQ
jgi:predicted RNase H-like nuclease (RuvC/YqgF family)